MAAHGSTPFQSKRLDANSPSSHIPAEHACFGVGSVQSGSGACRRAAESLSVAGRRKRDASPLMMALMMGFFGHAGLCLPPHTSLPCPRPSLVPHSHETAVVTAGLGHVIVVRRATVRADGVVLEGEVNGICRAPVPSTSYKGQQSPVPPSCNPFLNVKTPISIEQITSKAKRVGSHPCGAREAMPISRLQPCCTKRRFPFPPSLH